MQKNNAADPFFVVCDKTQPPDVVFRVGVNLTRVGNTGTLFLQVNEFYVEALANACAADLNSRFKTFMKEHAAELLSLIHGVPDEGGFAYASALHQVIGGRLSLN